MCVCGYSCADRRRRRGVGGVRDRAVTGLRRTVAQPWVGGRGSARHRGAPALLERDRPGATRRNLNAAGAAADRRAGSRGRGADARVSSRSLSRRPGVRVRYPAAPGSGTGRYDATAKSGGPPRRCAAPPSRRERIRCRREGRSGVGVSAAVKGCQARVNYRQVDARSGGADRRRRDGAKTRHGWAAHDAHRTLSGCLWVMENGLATYRHRHWQSAANRAGTTFLQRDQSVILTNRPSRLQIRRLAKRDLAWFGEIPHLTLSACCTPDENCTGLACFAACAATAGIPSRELRGEDFDQM